MIAADVGVTAADVLAVRLGAAGSLGVAGIDVSGVSIAVVLVSAVGLGAAPAMPMTSAAAAPIAATTAVVDRIRATRMGSV